MSRDIAFRKKAINNEMDSLLYKNTWAIDDLPSNSKAIRCKWVFIRKYNNDGSVQTFQARIVVKGFRQNKKKRINYFDTFIRALLDLLSIYNLYVYQMIVKTTFLNGELHEDVYMEQLEGFTLPGNEHKICKLINIYMN